MDDAHGVVAKCEGSIRRMIRRRYGHLPRQDVEEIEQEALLAVCRRVEDYDESRGVCIEGFLTSVALCAARHAYRRTAVLFAREEIRDVEEL